MARPISIDQTSADLAPVVPPWREAREVEDLAHEVIARHDSFRFIDEREFRIRYVFATGGPPDEARIDAIAKCRRGTGSLGFLAECEFVIEVNEWYWVNFPQHREAVVLHELLHVGVTDKGRPTLHKHDVEEFIGVVLQHGPWEHTRRRFAEALLSWQRSAEQAAEGDLSRRIVDAVADEAGEAASRREDGSVVIDAGKLAELRNRAADAREGRDA